jgi:uncharacterized membrane protein YtjA (UPF0391 family)
MLGWDDMVWAIAAIRQHRPSRDCVELEQLVRGSADQARRRNEAHCCKLLLKQRRSQPQLRRQAMLGWAVTFLIIALIAAVLGFGGIATAAVEIAKIIFFVAIILFVISLVFGLMRRRSARVP